MKTSTVIQAGGRSSRMGRDKGLVKIAGTPMIEHLLQRVQGLTDTVHLTTNAPQDYAYLGLPMASDSQPGAGALPGLLTALTAASGEFVLVVACDMPFLDRELLAYLLQLAPQADVVVPKWDGRYQPMCAVYKRDVIMPAIQHALQNGQKRLISFYSAVQVLQVDETTIAQLDPNGCTFFNVNTPEDVAIAEQMLDDQ